MQATSDLWKVLCREYQAESRASASAERCAVAEKFLNSARTVLRPESERFCDALEIVGDVLSAAGRSSDAIGRFEEALALATRLNFKASRARLAAKLTMLLEASNRSEAALARGEEALTAFEALGDVSQHSVLLNHLGVICRRQGNMDESEVYYQRALKLATESHGPTHPDVATAMNNLGVMLTEKQDFVRAESVHMEALGLREKCFGPMHPEVAQSMANLGAVYHWTGEYGKAQGFYQGAVKIYQAFCPADDPQLITVRQNMEALAIAANQ